MLEKSLATFAVALGNVLPPDSQYILKYALVHHHIGSQFPSTCLPLVLWTVSNCISYRHKVEARKPPSHVIEKEEARLEVQSLLDQPGKVERTEKHVLVSTCLPLLNSWLASSQTGSGVAERISEGRRER